MLRGCIDDYGMIEAGDKIAVGVSGGKDSLTLLVTLAELRRFYPKPFELVALSLHPGYEDMSFDAVAALCERIGVPYIVKQTEIARIIFDIRKEPNPCALCAKMRRGALNDLAKSVGCNKVALGHHYDDAVETFVLSLFYEGRIGCFLPVTYLSRADLTVIRPLLYMTERDIRNFAARQSLPVVYNPCPADKHTKREEVKELLRTLESTHSDLRKHIFGAMQRYPLGGWGKISHTAQDGKDSSPESSTSAEQ